MRTALLVLLTATLASASWAASGSGIFLIPQGRVQVKDPDGVMTTVSHRVPLFQGSEIKTGDASAALVTLSDGSKIALGPGSRFSIGQANSAKTIFNLAAGKLKAYFAGVFSGRLEVRTPTAVCAVRGTEFEVAAGRGGTNVDVVEGHLEVSDNQGRQAVVTSEEEVSIGAKGMTEAPHMVPLNSPLAQAAARPLAVAMELSKQQARTMIEDMRNRELKANEEQLGKSVIDAFGNRVRIEEYLLRPASNEFELLFLNQSKTSGFNYGNLTETFNSTLPNNPAQIPAIVSETFFSPTAPSNWLTNVSFFASNTIDSIKENVALGSPVAIPFTSYGLGTLYYPSSQDFTQVLSGPGVPGGTRTQFEQSQSWNGSELTFTQSAPNLSGVLTAAFQGTLNPATGAETQTILDAPTYDGIVTGTSLPSGASKADLLETTQYADGSTVSVEKFLVSNSGNILDFSNPSDSDFSTPGNYNMEDVISSNLFQGRSINVVIAPEILSQQGQASAAAGSSSFQP